MKLKPWQDAPTCPYCGSACGLGASQYGITTEGMIICASCGRHWQGTPEQVEQARKADEAWERREAWEAKGPRMRAVKRRARKPTAQVPLFGEVKR